MEALVLPQQEKPPDETLPAPQLERNLLLTTRESLGMPIKT